MEIQSIPPYTSPLTACTSGSTTVFCETPTNIVSSSHGAHPHGSPSNLHTSMHQALFGTTSSVLFSTGDEAVGTPQISQCLNGLPGCLTSLSANSLPIKGSTFQDIVEIQRKQA